MVGTSGGKVDSFANNLLNSQASQVINNIYCILDYMQHYYTLYSIYALYSMYTI